MAEMIDMSSGISQLASHSGSTLESYVLPPNLRVDEETNLDQSCMEVIKVSKVRVGTLWLVEVIYQLKMLILFLCYVVKKFTERKATNSSIGDIIQSSFDINHIKSTSGDSKGPTETK